LANPPTFPPPERPDEDAVYANQSVYKRPLMHTQSTPAPEKPERRKPPPKPKALPDNLAAEIKSVRRRNRTESPDDVISSAPTRFVSKQASEGDIIPIKTAPASLPDYENDNDLVWSPQDQQRASLNRIYETEQRPAVPSRGRSDTSMSPPNTIDKKPVARRTRAETVANVFSSPPPRPRGLMSPPHIKHHDYEEIHDELG